MSVVCKSRETKADWDIRNNNQLKLVPVSRKRVGVAGAGVVIGWGGSECTVYISFHLLFSLNTDWNLGNPAYFCVLFMIQSTLMSTASFDLHNTLWDGATAISYYLIVSHPKLHWPQTASVSLTHDSVSQQQRLEQLGNYGIRAMLPQVIPWKIVGL